MSLKQTSVGLVFFVVVSLFFINSVEAQEALTTGAQPLFLDTNLSADGGRLAAPEIIRGRYVNINGDALASTASAPASTIQLNLFADLSLTAVQKRVESNLSGSYTWIGELAKGAKTSALHSSVILVVRDGLITGKVALDGDIFTINAVDGSNLHIIAQVDPQWTDPETQIDFVLPPTDKQPDAAPTASQDSESLTTSDNGSVIDLLVMYTDDARVQRGGTVGIQSIIELGVAESNQAYEQSGVVQRLYLVHMQEVEHDENTNGTDLGLFRGTGDAELNVVHTLRNTYHADFSKLVVNTSGCGIAYLQTTPGGLPNFEDDAFSVTDESCISPNYTFEHELGHNMGLRHDWYLDDSTTPYPYAHGYADRSEGWRTIMSYNRVCSDDGGSCTRLLYFSNPNNTYNGNPMGLAGTTPANCIEDSFSPEPETCVADNTSVLNNMTVNNSRFRISQITWTGASSTDWSDANNWEIEQGAANRSSGASSTTVNRVPLAIDDVVIPPGLGNYPSLSGTHNARNVTIQNGASLTMSGGTLSVYGHWDEEGTGEFDGIGGTINFVGRLPQIITQNAGSNFNHVTIGDGISTIEVMLESDLDIDGDLIIKAGANLDAGTRTINVAGNWNEQSASAFTAGTSTVIFDGVTQNVDKTTSIDLLDEAFNDGIDKGYSSANIPAGWTRQSGWYVGGSGGNGEALAQGDAWLHSPALTLLPGVNYNLTVDFDDRGGSDTLGVFFGTSADSGSQINGIGTVNTTSTGDFNFSVDTPGTYYIGFFHDDLANGSSQSFIDNVVVSGLAGLNFHNLQVNSSDAVTVNQSVSVANDLTTNSGGTLDINGQILSAEGNVVNNGSLQDALDTPNATTTQFAFIQNEAATVIKHQGVEITPSGGSLGSTVVVISGNQECTGSALSDPVERCFDITPATVNAATIRFYYEIGEANGNAENAASAYHWNGLSWDLETGSVTRSSGADPRWVQVTDVTDFSPFALDDGAAVVEYTVGGMVSGLLGSGLVLQNNTTDDLPINAEGPFTFANALADGSEYEVIVKTPPNSPSQTCVVSLGTGELDGFDVTDVMVICTTNSYSVGGTVSGLEGSGLILQNNGTDNLMISADGDFTFVPVLDSGSDYVVTVLTDPSDISQTCTVSNESGTLADTNVINVNVSCVTDKFTVGGNVSGLAGTGLVLQNNAGEDLPITAEGDFTFAIALEDGSEYEVTVDTPPNNLSQTCIVSNGSGALAGIAVTDVAVTCTTNTYTVGGTVVGLEGSGLVLQNNGKDDQTINPDGGFTFVTELEDGSDFVVTVLTQPTEISQTCTVNDDNGIGTLAGSNVTNVTVSCVTDTFTVGGNISGLAGVGLVLQNNAGDDLSIAIDGSFTFAIALDDGTDYAVTVKTEPNTPSQACSLTNENGKLAGIDIANVNVSCVNKPENVFSDSFEE